MRHLRIAGAFRFLQRFFPSNSCHRHALLRHGDSSLCRHLCCGLMHMIYRHLRSLHGRRRYRHILCRFPVHVFRWYGRNCGTRRDDTRRLVLRHNLYVRKTLSLHIRPTDELLRRTPLFFRLLRLALHVRRRDDDGLCFLRGERECRRIAARCDTCIHVIPMKTCCTLRSRVRRLFLYGCRR